MSIILIDKKSSLSRSVSIPSQFLSTTLLKKFAATELHCHPSELKIYHLGIDLQYKDDEIVKQGQKIQYSIQSKPQDLPQIQVKKKGIIYPDELQKIIQNSKIIIVKSANEENIQKSKQNSLWATTFTNQEKLKYFFNNFPNVILIFATNKSFQIKGLARMESQPEKITDKSVWAGVSNIRLGGNFKIKWLRKKSLSLVNVQKSLGASFKQVILKSGDGQQLDPSYCKKLAHFFEIPNESYYPVIEENASKGNELLKPKIISSNFEIFKGIHLPLPGFAAPKVELQKHQSSSSSDKSSSSQFEKKQKKIKKQKKRKSKKHRKSKHKKHQSNSSSQDISSSDSSDRSSISEKKRRKFKRDKTHKKNKKHKKHRS